MLVVLRLKQKMFGVGHADRDKAGIICMVKGLGEVQRNSDTFGPLAVANLLQAVTKVQLLICAVCARQRTAETVGEYSRNAVRKGLGERVQRLRTGLGSG